MIFPFLSTPYPLLSLNFQLQMLLLPKYSVAPRLGYVVAVLSLEAARFQWFGMWCWDWGWGNFLDRMDLQAPIGPCHSCKRLPLLGRLGRENRRNDSRRFPIRFNPSRRTSDPSIACCEADPSRPVISEERRISHDSSASGMAFLSLSVSGENHAQGMPPAWLALSHLQARERSMRGRPDGLPGFCRNRTRFDAALIQLPPIQSQRLQRLKTSAPCGLAGSQRRPKTWGTATLLFVVCKTRNPSVLTCRNHWKREYERPVRSVGC